MRDEVLLCVPGLGNVRHSAWHQLLHHGIERSPCMERAGIRCCDFIRRQGSFGGRVHGTGSLVGAGGGQKKKDAKQAPRGCWSVIKLGRRREVFPAGRESPATPSG